jgi:hypothetical protein
MLASDCTWHAHVEHVVAKATKAAVYAMGSVLHNRNKLDTEIRRVVLLAETGRYISGMTAPGMHGAEGMQKKTLYHQ